MRLAVLGIQVNCKAVSIHAPRVGCDTRAGAHSGFDSPFQSTHPVWGATGSLYYYFVVYMVSIHAPRVGCDSKERKGCFNPRTPCGVRQDNTIADDDAEMFQSTHPVWGATSFRASSIRFAIVSIHAPRVGCDKLVSLFVVEKALFQSTHPVWGATPAEKATYLLYSFQSTHPVWGATPPASMSSSRT